ncbi:hypothetical protein [Chloroflexus sp.]|uniref:gasdermin n=1 Tax=Chloroflexus sp. TaxID=1904827 RepID=UPI002ADD9A1B|nr:hypothetical protein [Chloroflexus sp.]
MILHLCPNDPLVSLVHDLFGANAVRVPDARIRPLSVVIHRDNRSVFRGSLLPLLTDSSPLSVQPAVSQLIDISGRRSRRISLDLGLHILRGFLYGFGVPAASLATSIQGAATVSFSFPTAMRVAYDVNALGWALAGRAIDRSNPAAAVLFEQTPYELLLIDSVLTSRHITITLSGSKGQRLNVDIDALRQMLNDLGGQVGVSGDSELEVTLASPHDLTFAFSCVRLFFDDEGFITAIPPDLNRRVLGSAGGLTVRYTPDRVLLSAQPGLLVWDRLPAISPEQPRSARR